MRRILDPFEKLWKESKVVAILLCLIAGISALWLDILVPAPGVAVAVLGAVAAVMSFRPDMKIKEKAAWMCIIALLLTSEIGAIRKDRSEAAAAALRDRAAQDASFRDIRNQQNSDFNATATTLKGQINQLNDNLKVATAIFYQTRPHSALFIDNAFILNLPDPPNNFQPDTDYVVKFSYADYGSEAASMAGHFGKLYVGKDDRAAETEMATAFEQEWKNRKPLTNFGIIQPGVSTFWTDTLKIPHAPKLGETVFFLRRIEYKDSTGVWWSDRCDSFQLEKTIVPRTTSAINPTVIHSCYVLMNPRYPAKRPF